MAFISLTTALPPASQPPQLPHLCHPRGTASCSRCCRARRCPPAAQRSRQTKANLSSRQNCLAHHNRCMPQAQHGQQAGSRTACAHHFDFISREHLALCQRGGVFLRQRRAPAGRNRAETGLGCSSPCTGGPFIPTHIGPKQLLPQTSTQPTRSRHTHRRNSCALRGCTPSSWKIRLRKICRQERTRMSGDGVQR